MAHPVQAASPTDVQVGGQPPDSALPAPSPGVKLKPLLVVCHCPSPNVEALRDAVVSGARAGLEDATGLIVRSPFEAGPQDVLDCGALILGTTENFGYMNGALKDFFERVYYPCLEHTQGLSYALFVKGGQDGEGARSSVERIVAGMRWRAVAEPLIMSGPYDPAWSKPCQTLGMTVAAGLSAGLF
ncbi:MAG: flavodoxin family protein [Gammaproteobacteria bacterium]